VRRIIIGVTAAALLITATAAFAAANSYTAKMVFSPGKAGTARKPVLTGIVQTLQASAVAPNKRAAPLTNITTTIYGMKSTVTKKTPKCTDTLKMSVLKTDSFCPPGALVATGPVNALLGGPDLTLAGAPCNPYLHVWNGGPGKLWFFFTTSLKYTCATLHTGDTPAYPGFVREVGKNMVIDVPLPPNVSTRVANHANLYGSLIKEVLTYRKGFQASFACKAGKRPWAVKYTAQGVPTKTVTGSSHC
jgi:hypothetical protein